MSDLQRFESFTESKRIMLRSWTLGTAFGIPIRVHWSFFLLPVLVVVSNLKSGLGIIMLLLSLLFGVFVCVILHELGHALMARRYGIPTLDITIYPIGGVARLMHQGGPGQPMLGERPWEEFWVAVAGPAVNVVIAGLLVGVLTLTSVPITLQEDGLKQPALWELFLNLLLALNVLMVVFNMLPAFPMDGGRVFRALLATRLGYLRATQIASVVGMVMAGLFVCFGMVKSPFLVIIGMFVYLGASQELIVARQRSESTAHLTLHASAVPSEPNFSGFTWDRQARAWVEWRNGQPVQASFTESQIAN